MFHFPNGQTMMTVPDTATARDIGEKGFAGQACG
jgi:hypothetical protein